MATFVAVPVERVAAQTLHSLLEEYATRDGTDYGERETPVEERVAHLRRQLGTGDLALLYDLDSESWDLLPSEQAQSLLNEAEEDQGES